MKKFLVLLLVTSILICKFCNAQSADFWLNAYSALHTQSTSAINLKKFQRVGTDSATVDFENLSANLSYFKIQTSTNAAFTIPFDVASDSITGSSTGTLTIHVPTGTAWRARFITYDSSFTTAIDTSNIALILYAASIVNDNVPVTIDGYTASTTFSPGNDTVVYIVRLGYDSLCAAFYEYVHDTLVTTPGATITRGDTVNALPTSFTAWRQVIVIQFHGGTSDTSITKFTTLSNLPPTINLYGQVTHDYQSYDVTVVVDMMGTNGSIAFLHRSITALAWDTIIWIPSPILGPQIHTFHELGDSDSSYYYDARADNANGFDILGTGIVTLDPAPLGLAQSVQSVTVTTVVNIAGNYSNNPGNSSSMIMGWSNHGSNILLQSHQFSGMVNSGTQTWNFPLPPTSGIYDAHVSGYEEVTIIPVPDDTMSFQVTLTAIEEYVNTNSLVERFKVLDTAGRQIMSGISDGKLPNFAEQLPPAVYFIECWDRNKKLVYSNKKFIQ